MKIISFSQCSFNLIILLLTPIIGTISFVCKYFLFKIIQEDKTENDKHPLYLILFMCFGNIFSFIFDYFSIRNYAKQIKQKEIKEHYLNDNENNHFAFLQSRNVPEQATIFNIKNLIWLFICAFNDVISSLGLIITSMSIKSKYRETEMKIFLILFTIGLSKLPFEYPIHRHQVVSIILIIIGEIIVYIVDDVFNPLDLLFVFWYFIQALLFVNTKWLMNQRYVTPFRIVGFKGLFGVIITVALIAIANSIECEEYLNLFCDRDYIETFGYFAEIFSDVVTCSSYLLFALTCFLLNSGYEIINMAYNPNHFAVTSTVSSVLQIICSAIVNGSLDQLTLHLIGNVFVLLGCIMYNEVIIVHFCGLEFNTRAQIEYRSKCESNTIENIIIPERESNDNSEMRDE